MVYPDIKIAAFLELEQKEMVCYVERVRLINNFPVIYLKNYIPYKYCEGLLDEDLENNTLFRLMEEKYQLKLEWGRRYFKAVPALGDVVQKLGVDIAAPVMYLEQIIYTTGSRPIECSSVWINSDKFDIVSVLRR